jgi:hypothetical protein
MEGNMFEIIDKNTIVSDEGFSVEVLGRTGIKYTEGNKVLMIDSEILAGPAGLVVYSNSVRNWEKPFQGEMIDKGKIIDNLKRAFLYKGFDIEVI